MTDAARVAVETIGDAVVARVAGDIDLSNIADVAELLEASIDRTRRRHIVDLSATGYLDSVGIRYLCSLAERLRLRRGDLRLVVPAGSVVRPVVVITGVAQLIPTHDSVTEALAAARD